MNYSAAFLLITWFANLRFFKNQLLNRFLGGSAALLIAVYLIGGLEALEDLRDAYLQNDVWLYMASGILVFDISVISLWADFSINFIV
jgi:hypothetical protein